MRAYEIQQRAASLFNPKLHKVTVTTKIIQNSVFEAFTERGLMREVFREKGKFGNEGADESSLAMFAILSCIDQVRYGIISECLNITRYE